jgi:tagatose-1,6-bisphosphate aldolase
MATQAGNTFAPIRIDTRSRLRTAMQEHSNNLRISINNLETFARDISHDLSMSGHLPQIYGIIQVQRASLSDLGQKWREFDNEPFR